MIGVPLFADECTTHQQRITFARLLVEVDVTKDLPKSVSIEDGSGRVIEQTIHFEWAPCCCLKCGTIVHDYSKKKVVQGKEGPKPIQRWVPKVVQTTSARAPVSSQDSERSREAVDVVMQSAKDTAVIQGKPIEEVGGVITADAAQQSTSDTEVMSKPKGVAVGVVSEFPRSEAPTQAPVWNIITRGQKGKDVIEAERPGVVIHNVDEVGSISFTLTRVHCRVGDQWLFTVVYGLHIVDDRKSLWVDLGNLDKSIHEPWCITGDFNVVLSTGDRDNGAPVSNYETQDFNQLLTTSDLSEFKSCGHFFSWSNKGTSDARISSRIDRGLVSSLWITKYPHVVVDYMNPGLSVHSPLIFQCAQTAQGKVRPFKFFNHMAGHAEFLLQFANMSARLDNAREELQRVQTQMQSSPSCPMLIQAKKECTLILHKLLNVEESALRQKSRIM
ncbi:uncharacterized protein LOC104884178 [Beta vulgaris subsp. vulgaris]|uniref:uncharacterized protein LOC104884178 n=1 Tax=Beta vulgaris subsp. vulgaris TaxID=3555 RepID=UPI00053FA25B|nr:uncharacterized protein LOC104884178 [Beta vulgaris subsp. vulgaris]